jgi:signal transduction histidine kinase/CheY-like chemotaxis protein
MRKSLVLFVVSLAFVFLLLVILFFWGHRIHRQSAVKLLQATNTLMMDNPSVHLMDSALFTLHDAENNFRLYTVLYERKYLQNFSAELGDVLSMVDTISYSLNSNDQQFKKLIQEKETVAGNIATLKMATDSMLAGSLKNDRIDKLLSSIPSYSVSQIKKEKVTMDTVNNVQTPGGGKKGIFKRLGNAVVNKRDTVKAQISIRVRTKDGHVVDKETYDAMQLRKVVTEVNGYYKNILKEQLTNRLKLNEEESSLAGNNIAMMEQLKLLLVSLRENAAKQHDATRQSAHHTATNSIFNMKSMMLAELIALLLSIAIIVAGVYLVRKKNEQLERAKQVAEEQTKARTDFLNNMSHEMRTPLTSVAGFTEQLEHTPLSPEQKTMLSSIEFATNMLIQVVNDVLDFSKLENDYISFSPQSFVLYQVYIDVVTMMRVQVVKKNLEFQVGFEGDKNGQVRGDIFRLKQVLINLISNAVRYTDKGSITVMATLTDRDSTTSLFSFTVTDTGEGISAEARQHLFERFFQAGATRGNTKGTGLGLAITKRLITLQGGEISVKSELHKGSSFTCDIPYEKVSLPLMINGQQDIQELTGAFMEGRYILIADDQEMNLLLLKLILTRWKCRFDMATDGISAMELFNQHHYDLVLLDQHMPGMSGIEVMTHIRRDRDPVKAGTVCLALTANISAEDEAAFRQAGFNGWLLKPFREKDIYREVMKYLLV